MLWLFWFLTKLFFGFIFKMLFWVGIVVLVWWVFRRVVRNVVGK
jgi:hypothetical protein